jgi:uncharacterized protein
MVNEATAAAMESLVRGMILALVDDPDAAQIAGVQLERTVVVHVTVGADDAGKVIGKQGRTARSLRTITMAAGRKLGLVCELNLNGRAARVGDDL